MIKKNIRKLTNLKSRQNRSLQRSVNFVKPAVNFATHRKKQTSFCDLSVPQSKILYCTVMLMMVQKINLPLNILKSVTKYTLTLTLIIS